MRRTLWIIAAVAGMLLTVLVVARLNRPRVATLAALTGVQSLDLDMARVQADVAALTRAPSRLTGSPGERAARTHILSTLQALGARGITQQEFSVPVPVTRMAALEVPIAYVDQDGSGGFTDRDAPLYPACSGGVPAGLLYLPGVTDLLTAWSLSVQGVGTGWVGLTLGDSGGAVLTDDELQDLAMDGSCTL